MKLDQPAITNYELRITNYNEDRFRRNGSDTVGHVIDMPSSWSAANANGDGRSTTCPTWLRVRLPRVNRTEGETGKETP